MRILLASLALATLSACGLSPMYAGGGSGAVAQSLAAIEVAPIEGRAGWLVRSALKNALPQRVIPRRATGSISAWTTGSKGWRSCATIRSAANAALCAHAIS